MESDAKPKATDTVPARESAPAPSKQDAPVAAQTDVAAASAVSVAEPAAPQEPVDHRQLWYCLDPYGPRTKCPPFHSDSHLTPNDPVHGGRPVCPACGSLSAQKAEVYDEAVRRSPYAPPSTDPRLVGRS